MALMTAKYRSQCAICGERISPGQQIEYAKGISTRHATCTPVAIPPDAIHLSIGQGYAAPQFSGWHQSDVIINPGRRHGSSAERSALERSRLGQDWDAEHPEERMPDGPHETHAARYQEWSRGMTARYEARKTARDAAIAAQLGGDLPHDDGPEYLYVLTASQRYYCEEGMSFGVGEESGSVYSAKCRPATDAEAAPLRAQRAVADTRRQAREQLTILFRTLVETGEYPEGMHQPEGDRIDLEPQTLYGGGRWFVLGPEWVWAVINNGADGDNWSANNVRTGGAGAIGRRVPATAERAAQIRLLSAQGCAEGRA